MNLTEDSKHLSALYKDLACIFQANGFDAACRKAFCRFDDVDFSIFSSFQEVRRCVLAMIAAGRTDLAFGRLIEGHVNAIQLIHRYGGADQIALLNSLTSDGARLGVWNSNLADAPFAIRRNMIFGGKNYASGAGLLTHALVTTHANDPAACRMFLLSLDPDSIEINSSWWQPLGMKRTNSHIVRWRGPLPSLMEEIGAPSDYQRQPFFSAGALRFVAVHTGGIVRLYEGFRSELQAKDRSGHPQQERRLAEAFVAAQSAVDIVLGVAERYREDDPDLLNQISYARMAILDIAEAQIARVHRGVGMAAQQASHSLYDPLVDLGTYIRQPDPDGVASELGAAAPDINL